MKAKRSILSYVLASFVFVYAVLNLGNFYRSNDSYYDVTLDERRSDLVSYLSLASTAFKSGDASSIESVLQESIRLHRVDFFLLEEGGHERARFPLGDRQKFPVEASALEDNRVYETDDLLLGTLSVGGRRLLLGSFKSRGHFLRFVFDQHKWSLLADITIVMLVITLIVSHFLNDIRQLTAKFRTTGTKGFAAVEARSVEAETLKLGLQGFEQQVDSLRARFELLDANTLPALKGELFSGQEPPYDFDCTLVRTDINSYSTSLSELGANAYLPFVNEFFSRLAIVVDRYGGRVKEYLGDEAIFYFKDAPLKDGATMDSVNLALAAIRDLQAEALDIERATIEKIGYPFTVKSSLAFGSLHFGPLVHQINLSGSLFIETVRLLNEATTKDRSQTLLLERTAEKVGPNFEVAMLKRAALKGVKGEVMIHEVTRFKELSLVLAAGTPELDQLTYYRRDEHLDAIFEWLTNDYDILESSVIRKTLDILKSQTLRSLSPGTVSRYCRAIGDWQGRLKTAGPEAKRELFWQLSSLVTLAYRWKLDPSAKSTVREALMPNFSLSDDRLIANTIDALLVLMVSEPEPIIARLTTSSNNRVRANALVKEGVTNLDVKVLKLLERLIASRDPHQVASGLYALAEIAGHYLEIDAVYFEANLKAQRLIARALEHLSSDNQMVRRQAGRLQAKSARPRPAA